jgi:hypothetical protein
MDNDLKTAIPDFLNILGLIEEPMGMFFTNTKPDKGYSPYDSL